VEISVNDGQNWEKAALGRDERARTVFANGARRSRRPPSGSITLQVRCTNTKGEAQPAEPNWNGGGFMRNVIERSGLILESTRDEKSVA
jgi:hypothetical protein